MWLGWGSVLMGLASIMFAFPHFFAPKIDIQAIDSATCTLNSSYQHPSCSKNYELRNFRLVIFQWHFSNSVFLYRNIEIKTSKFIKVRTSNLFQNIFSNMTRYSKSNLQLLLFVMKCFQWTTSSCFLIEQSFQ